MWSHLLLFGKFSWAKSIDFNTNPYNRELCEGERFPHIYFKMVSERLETESCLVWKWLKCELCFITTLLTNDNSFLDCNISLMWPHLKNVFLSAKKTRSLHGLYNKKTFLFISYKLQTLHLSKSVHIYSIDNCRLNILVLLEKLQWCVIQG